MENLHDASSALAWLLHQPSRHNQSYLYSVSTLYCGLHLCGSRPPWYSLSSRSLALVRSPSSCTSRENRSSSRLVWGLQCTALILPPAINQSCLFPPYISHHLPVYSNRTDIRNRNLQNILVLRGSIYRYGSIVKYLWSGKKQKYEFHLSHIFRKRIREFISLMFCDGDLKRAQMRDARCADVQTTLILVW